MKAYTVHEPPEAPAERIDRADSLVFVKEGMSVAALFFAPVWLLLKRHWLAFAGYCALVAALVVLDNLFDLGGDFIGWGIFILHLVIAFEADSIERWSLERDGWQELGAVTGHSRDQCERNFFDHWLPQQPVIMPRKDSDPGLGASVV